MADVIFAIGYLQMQQELQRRLRDAGLELTFPQGGEGIFDEPAVAEVPLLPPTFMDDLMLWISAPSSRNLVERIREATAIMKATCDDFGLQLNLLAGKTECVARWCGQEALVIRDWLEQFRSDSGDAILLPSDVGPIRLVSTYKHLGSKVESSKAFSQEAEARGAKIKQAVGALAYRIFSSGYIPLKSKVNVLKACGVSTGTCHAGTWFGVAKAPLQKIATQIMLPLRRAMRQHRPPEEGEHLLTNKQIRAATKHPRLEATLIVEKARMAQQISTQKPRQVLALLATCAGEVWKDELCSALQIIQRVLWSKLGELPCPRRRPGIWEKWWIAWPLQWKAMLKKFLEVVAADEDLFIRAATVCEVSLLDDEVVQEDLECLCQQCGLEFSTLQGLATHRRRKHAHQCPTRRVVSTSRCPVCDVDFITRARARRHLLPNTGAKHCAEVFQSGVLPLLSEKDQEEADAREAAEAKSARAGSRQKVGVPAKRFELRLGV
jgi:hypothetical protein